MLRIYHSLILSLSYKLLCRILLTFIIIFRQNLSEKVVRFSLPTPKVFPLGKMFMHIMQKKDCIFHHVLHG